jgi:hypothetical protein
MTDEMLEEFLKTEEGKQVFNQKVDAWEKQKIASGGGRVRHGSTEGADQSMYSMCGGEAGLCRCVWELFCYRARFVIVYVCLCFNVL